MRYGTYLVPAAIVLTLGSLACKPPKTAEQIKAETQAAFNAVSYTHLTLPTSDLV